MTIIEQLAEFIKNADDVRTAWLEDGLVKVYVRKGYQYILNKTVPTLNVIFNKETHLGEDSAQFLAKFHEINPWEATFVECFNPGLEVSLIQNGWLSSDHYTHGYFMPKDTEKFYNQMFLQQKFGVK
jgi:hypothetical protein